MEKEELEQLARQVLEAYERKDIVFFEAAFDDGVVLRDWNHEVLGKEAAILEFKNNFDSARTLKIEILQIYCSENRAAVELQIEINKQERLSVIDVIGFNGGGQIFSIVAYKGL